MKASGKQMSPGLSFAAGALVGAFAVFVPFTSAGHPGPSSGAVRSSAPAASRNAVDPDSASPTKPDSSTANAVSNETTCDVQLD